MPRTAALSRVLSSLCLYDHQTLHEIEASCSGRTKMAPKPWNPLPSRPNSAVGGTQLKSNRLKSWRNASGTRVIPKEECQRWRRSGEILWSHWRSSENTAMILRSLFSLFCPKITRFVRFGDWRIYGDSNLLVLYNFYRRVNTELALQCTDADLLILEGMGRYVTHLCSKMQVTSCDRKL